MRITISSPDGLGDFVLRMPLFEALCDAGHDLQIFLRPPALELAAAVLPAASIEKISEDPYARLVRFRRSPFAPELEENRHVRPRSSGDRALSAQFLRRNLPVQASQASSGCRLSIR